MQHSGSTSLQIAMFIWRLVLLKWEIKKWIERSEIEEGFGNFSFVRLAMNHEISEMSGVWTLCDRFTVVDYHCKQVNNTKRILINQSFFFSVEYSCK